MLCTVTASEVPPTAHQHWRGPCLFEHGEKGRDDIRFQISPERAPALVDVLT